MLGLTPIPLSTVVSKSDSPFYQQFRKELTISLVDEGTEVQRKKENLTRFKIFEYWVPPPGLKSGLLYPSLEPYPFCVLFSKYEELIN